MESGGIPINLNNRYFGDSSDPSTGFYGSHCGTFQRTEVTVRSKDKTERGGMRITEKLELERGGGGGACYHMGRVGPLARPRSKPSARDIVPVDQEARDKARQSGEPMRRLTRRLFLGEE